MSIASKNHDKVNPTLTLLFSVKIWLMIIVFAGIEVGAGLAKYYVGRGGKEMADKHVSPSGRKRLEQLNAMLGRLGAPVLLLMAIPGFSTLLAIAAGIRGLKTYTFVVWSFTAFLTRDWLVVLAIHLGYGWLA